MPNEVFVREEEEVRVLEIEVNPREALNRVVDAIRHDSQQESTVFLAESIVPHGGE